jgi:hypothetical protein
MHSCIGVLVIMKANLGSLGGASGASVSFKAKLVGPELTGDFNPTSKYVYHRRSPRV